jgi:hypothetical protein
MSAPLRAGRLASMTLVALSLALPSEAQTADEDQKVSAEAADASEDDGPVGRLRRLQGWVEGVVADIHRRGIYPEVGSIASGSGLGGGASLRYPSLNGSRLGVELEGLWSVRRYHQYTVRAGAIGRWREALELGRVDTNLTSLFDVDEQQTAAVAALFVEAVHRRSPQMDFFGLGTAGPGVKTDFALSGTSLDIVAQLQPTSRIGVAGRIGITDLELGPGTNESVLNIEDYYDESTAPGLGTDVRWFTVGLSGGADSRDSVHVPTDGMLVAGALWLIRSLDDRSRGLTRGALDVRVFEPIPSNNQVLAFRFLGSTDRMPDGGRTPFYYQYWLGGSHTLRGYSSYRYRGESTLHLSAEYRWRVFPMVDIVPFVDVGGVGESFGDLFQSTILASPGVGVWIRNDERFYFRVEWARGRDGNRFIWSLSPSF